MIVVDTSALMAVLLREPQADACKRVLQTEDKLLISAVIVAEALIVAARCNVGDEMTVLIDGLGFEIVGLDAAVARRVAAAYRRWDATRVRPG